MVEYTPDSFMTIVLDYMQKGGKIHWANACFGGKPKLRVCDDGQDLEIVVPPDTMTRLQREAWIRFEDFQNYHDVYILNDEDRRRYYWEREEMYRTGAWKDIPQEEWESVKRLRDKGKTHVGTRTDQQLDTAE